MLVITLISGWPRSGGIKSRIAAAASRLRHFLATTIGGLPPTAMCFRRFATVYLWATNRGHPSWISQKTNLASH